MSTWYIDPDGAPGNGTGDEPANAALCRPDLCCVQPEDRIVDLRVRRIRRRWLWTIFGIFALGALLLFVGGAAFGQASNSVGVAWSPAGTNATNVTYRVFVGTNSGSYQRSWSYTATNAWLPPAWLFVGTNFVAVATVQTLSPSNAVASDYSAEVQIVRIPPPAALQISGTLQASSNMVAWTATTNTFTVAVTPDQPAQFYRPQLASIRRLPDAINIITPPMP